jgi:hypothetical protein
MSEHNITKSSFLSDLASKTDVTCSNVFQVSPAPWPVTLRVPQSRSARNPQFIAAMEARPCATLSHEVHKAFGVRKNIDGARTIVNDLLALTRQSLMWRRTRSVHNHTKHLPVWHHINGETT